MDIGLLPFILGWAKEGMAKTAFLLRLADSAFLEISELFELPPAKAGG